MRQSEQNKSVHFFALSILSLASACTFDASTSVSGFLDGGEVDASIDAANMPPVADEQLLTMVRDTSLSITLTGSDPEEGPLSFSLSMAPSSGQLTGTPPDLTYTPNANFVGADAFAFTVADALGQMDSATVSITVTPPPSALYEPFDYLPGEIGNQFGLSEVGLTGSWTQAAANPSHVVAGSLSFGAKVTLGGHLLSPGGLNRFVGARPIAANALAGAGLLSDGSELWFSVIVGLGAGANQTNCILDVALASASFGTGSGDRFIQEADTVPGSGIGFTLGRGVPRAAQFLDTGTPNVDATSTGAYGVGEHGLIVGHIVWGATPLDNDSIELFRPNEDSMELGAGISKIEAIVDQSSFDTLTMHRGDRPVIDEIRFGSTLDSVF